MLLRVAARAELRRVTQAQVGQLKGAELRELQSVLAEIQEMVGKVLAE